MKSILGIIAFILALCFMIRCCKESEGTDFINGTLKATKSIANDVDSIFK